MIIFFSKDGLGNQIFQFAFLLTIANKEELIITIGFNKLKDVFNLHELFNMPIPNELMRDCLYRFVKYLSRIKIIGYVYQEEINKNGHLIESQSYSSHQGLLKNIRFVDRGFFQSEKFFEDSIRLKLIIQYKYIKKAISILAFIPEYKHKVFIHVRRGDYLSWTVLGKQNASLPNSYYRDRITYIYDTICNPYFIFLSDDPLHVEEEFCDIKDKIVIRGNYVGTDLAIMTLCKSGVLSNSSLSWWGAYLMNRPHKLFSPKYWLGFKSNIWFPEGVKPSFAESVEVFNIM